MAMKRVMDIIKSDKGSKDRSPLSDFSYDADNDVIEFLSTNCISLNLLYGGKVDSGIAKGHMSMISAPSQLGKSFIALQIIRNAQKCGMQVVVIDTERAFKKSMANSLKIDLSPDKIQVLRLNSLEAVESAILAITEEMTIEERKNTLFVVDSWGTLVTSKAVKDGLTGNDVSDMTEAKKKNRLANIILNTQATFFIVNHVYDNTGGFGDPLNIPGGRRIAFNCEAIVLGMSRAKDKRTATQTEIDGHIITAKTFKSRFSKGESKLQYRIKYEGGLDPFYGLLPDALDYGCIVKTGTKYSRPVVENDKEHKEADIYCATFWKPIFEHTDFKEWLEDKYTFRDESTVVDDEEFLDSIF